MIRFVSLFFIFFGLAAGSAHAVTDDFSVRTRVGTDTTPPTTPSLISAIPVASSQIDLAWSASTDDNLMGGYKVFRDAVQVATTSLTAYSDTGLTASTTYSYFVQAFDTDFNVSTSSNIIATTTLPLAATTTPPEPDSSGDADMSVDVISLTITPSLHSAMLTWKTNRYAKFELRWGRTTSYELGFVTNELYKKEHSTSITDLESGTTYEYQLVAYGRDGEQYLLSEGRFATEKAPDTLAPTNVSGLQALVQGKDVFLTWSNPADVDFSHVRIVRSYLFYPADPYDGFIAYQGEGRSFFDKNALIADAQQYYTVFSYDTNGNISSGAAVLASAAGDIDQGDTSVPEEDPQNDFSYTLVFSDLEAIQNQTSVSMDAIAADEPFTLRIAYDKLPEHLKTITVALSSKLDSSRPHSYLLRVNKDKTYYEATLAPVQTPGSYHVNVSVYDYQAKKLVQVEGVISVIEGDSASDEDLLGIPLSTSGAQLAKKSFIAWILLLLLLLFVLYRIISNLWVNQKTALGASKSIMAGLFGFIAVLGGLYLAYEAFTLETGSEALQAAAATVSLDTVGVIIIAVCIALCALAVCAFLLKKRDK